MEFGTNDQPPESFPPSHASLPPDQGPPPVSGTGWQSPYPPTHYGRSRNGWRILSTIFFIFSILANIVLFMVVAFLIFLLFATGHRRGMFEEEVIQTGPRFAKIAVIDVDGVILDTQAKRVYDQLKMARHDKAVKGLILRVNSPGGTISASDQIYNEIRKFRKQTNRPVIAFMQGMAASGGYYISVACEEIISEPTTITGSIGVIMQYFVLEQLLEDKLGILPVVVKAGQKKDWPSSYNTPTEEQLAYLQENLIQPAYQRFIEVVCEGREDTLTATDVERLADGGILTAKQAQNERMIDHIGYFDDAVELVKTKAGIADARVVEYQDTFSLSHLLRAQGSSALTFDRDTLQELSIPQVMYLWSGR